MLEVNFPYGMVSRGQMHNQISLQFLYAAYKAGDTALAQKVTQRLRKDMEQQLAFYQTLTDNRRDNLSAEEERNESLLKGLMALEQQFKNQPPPPVENSGQLQTQPVKPDSPR